VNWCKRRQSACPPRGVDAGRILCQLSGRIVAFQSQRLDARDDRRGFHAKQGGGTGGAEDLSAALRKRDRQIFALALLEFGVCQDGGCICRRGGNSGRSVRGPWYRTRDRMYLRATSSTRPGNDPSGPELSEIAVGTLDLIGDNVVE
jgi:hypothetical protein